MRRVEWRLIQRTLVGLGLVAIAAYGFGISTVGAQPAPSPRPQSTGDRWRTRQAMPTPRSGLGVTASITGTVYAIGGYANGNVLSVVEAYDPACDCWTTKAPLPEPRDCAGVTTANGKIYVIGGWSGRREFPKPSENSVFEYDPAANTWSTRTPMPALRAYLGVATASDGKIYAVGGSDTAYSIATNTVYEYDPIEDLWTTRASMPTAREFLAVAATNDGKLYAIGGQDPGRYPHNLATVEMYDPTTGTWTTRRPMPAPRWGLGLAVIGDGKIYAIGGWDTSKLAIVEAYNPTTDEWSSVTAMPSARVMLGAAVSNGTIFAVGGTDSLRALDTMEQYIPSGMMVNDYRVQLPATVRNSATGW